MTHPDIWGNPIQKELDVMRKLGVWTVIGCPEESRLVETGWTLAIKYDTDGNLVTCKAQLVAKGFTQIPSVDFFEMYASVV